MSVGSRGTNNPIAQPKGSGQGGAALSSARGKPGIQPGDSGRDYDAWWSQVQTAVAPWMYANPDQAADIKALAWQYRDATKDDIIDLMFQKGYASPGSTTTSGGSRGGGGGSGGGASKEQLYAGAAEEIRNIIGQYGGEGFTEEGIQAMAVVAVENKWNDAQLMQFLAPSFKNTKTGGTITASVDQIKALADSQLLTISDETAREYAVRIASSELTFEGVRSVMQDQAMLKFGSWAGERLQAGVSMRDMLLPARDRIAAELELSPEVVDLKNAKYLSMVQTTDEKTGQVRIATDSELIRQARKDERYASTNGAQRLATGYGTMLRQMFES